MARRSMTPPTAPRRDDPEAPAAPLDDGATDVVGHPLLAQDGVGGGPADETALLGAYALGALSAEQRVAVEERLAASPGLQDELRRLIPVAALLREADEAVPRAAAQAVAEPVAEADSPSIATPVAEPDAVPTVDAEVTALPDAGDDEPVAEELVARPEQGAPVVSAPPLPSHVAEGEPPVARVEAAPGSLSSRPAGRRRVTAAAAIQPRPSRVPATVAAWPLGRIAAGLAGLVAICAVLWALALVDRLEMRGREVDGLETELSRLRLRGDAAVVPLAPGASGPDDAEGVVVLVPSEGSLLVRASGLAASGEGRVYQLWFQGEAGGRWLVGPTFRVGERGAVLTELPVATPPFARLAISEEPSPGSGEPSGGFLLEGALPVDPEGG